MFKFKKKQTNYTQTTTALFLGGLFGFIWALLTAKETGKDFKAKCVKEANKAIRTSKRKLGKEFVRAKKEFGNEFETQLTNTFSTLKDKSKKVVQELVKRYN